MGEGLVLLFVAIPYIILYCQIKFGHIEIVVSYPQDIFLGLLFGFVYLYLILRLLL